MDENKSIDQIEEVKELEKIQEEKTEEKTVEEIQDEKPVEEIPLIKSGDDEPGDGDSDKQPEEEPTGIYAIVNRHVYAIENGANVDLCDIVADSKDNLPTGEDLIINRIGFGSFGYCITEREFYCLSSGGEWL